MPAGYEKIRDALIAKGMNDEDAKTTAAKIWNKHHKGSEAVGAHYDEKKNMSAPFNYAGFNLHKNEGGGSVLLGVKQLEPKRKVVEFMTVPGAALRSPEAIGKMGDQIGALIRSLRKREKVRAGFPNARARTILPHQVGELLTPHALENRLGPTYLEKMSQQAFDEAEKRLLKRLKELNMLKPKAPSDSLRDLFAKNSQHRNAMSAPVPTHPKNPRPS